MIEGVIERGSLSGSSEGRPVMAKLLVVSDLVGCLGGNDGKVLTELREVTGADIRIVEGEHILTCGSVNDTVVQVGLPFLFRSEFNCGLCRILQNTY